MVIGEDPVCTRAFLLFAGFLNTRMFGGCLSAGSGLPGAFSSASGEAAGSFCSAQEGYDSRFGQTQSPEGACEDAAHLCQGHPRWIRYGWLISSLRWRAAWRNASLCKSSGVKTKESDSCKSHMFFI